MTVQGSMPTAFQKLSICWENQEFCYLHCATSRLEWNCVLITEEDHRCHGDR